MPQYARVEQARADWMEEMLMAAELSHMLRDARRDLLMEVGQWDQPKVVAKLKEPTKTKGF
jgi:hypothetical protein